MRGKIYLLYCAVSRHGSEAAGTLLAVASVSTSEEVDAAAEDEEEDEEDEESSELWLGVEVDEEVDEGRAAVVDSRAGPCCTQEKRECGTLWRLE